MITLFRLLIGCLAAATFTAGAIVSGLAPPWPHVVTVGSATFFVAAIAQIGGDLLLSSPRAQSRWLRLFSLLAVCLVMLYAVLWIAFTHPVSSREGRVVGAPIYSAAAKLYLQGEPVPLPVTETLANMENDPDQVFEPISLFMVRASLLGSWLLMTATLMMVGTVGVRLLSSRSSEARLPAVADLSSRVAALPAMVADSPRSELQRALQTIEQAGNVPGAILTVAGMLEGEQGILGCVARRHRRTLDGYNLMDQIEDLSKQGLLPKEVASDCHWIRVRANMACHQKESVTLQDAHMAIDRGICIVEWWSRLPDPKA